MTLPTDQTLSCPNCGQAIKLTESLAAPLVAATRAEYERRLTAQTEAVAAEKLALSAQQHANDLRAAELAAAAENQQEQVDQAVRQQVREQVQQQLARDRKTIADEESTRARQEVDTELRTHKNNLEQQTLRIESLTQKLTSAQAAEGNSRGTRTSSRSGSATGTGQPGS
jgi:wobble nucleotide-excising tRNase